ncbi:hypothetical protein P7H50_03890 [Enterococcus durans]|uniref:hypothetical protein n=1 Tax=Enterococcus durans TaxID=53345 RepID=UPI00288E6BA4|nr:hypothetical protein [Enterococcus durans]MDT2836029.1 hypothetical protein [Enterococcus durans]
MEETTIDLVDLVIDSTNIASALEGISLFIGELNVHSLKVENLNILNGMIASVTCLAKQHSEDVIHLESKVPVNE